MPEELSIDPVVAPVVMSSVVLDVPVVVLEGYAVVMSSVVLDVAAIHSPKAFL